MILVSQLRPFDQKLHTRIYKFPKTFEKSISTWNCRRRTTVVWP